jgi:hypothetical protein
MAITTADGILVGMQPPIFFDKHMPAPEAIGVLQSCFAAPGIPGAGATPSPGLTGEAITSLAGCIRPGNPVSGNQYLASVVFTSGTLNNVYIMDRLWQNSGIAVTTTTAQTINSVTWPARDNNGTTNGEGVLIGIEVSTATTNGSTISNTTMSYTNQDGTSGRTATVNGMALPATMVAGSFHVFTLQAGDTGVRSIQSITLGTSFGGGAVHLVAFRPLCFLGGDGTYGGLVCAYDFMHLGLPRLYDNSNLFLVCNTATVLATRFTGFIATTRG